MLLIYVHISVIIIGFYDSYINLTLHQKSLIVNYIIQTIILNSIVIADEYQNNR